MNFKDLKIAETIVNKEGINCIIIALPDQVKNKIYMINTKTKQVDRFTESEFKEQFN